MGYSTRRAVPGRGQAPGFEHSPSRGPPAARRLGAVSVPALMCHVSSGASGGRFSESLPNCLCRTQAPSSQSSAMLSHPGPARPGFVGRLGDKLAEPSEGPDQMQAPGPSSPCFLVIKAESATLAPGWTSLPLPVPAAQTPPPMR